ncbi:aldolase/citrate lyase family protein [Rhodobacteraceae bacterium]|nr:aldolase/citrate lyase family protein [Paracoccaceae bacterium]
MENALKQIWSRGEPVLNGWCSVGSPFTAEIMAAQGFDSITIDGQHGALDYSDALPMFQAMRGSGKTLLARVPWREPGVIMKYLDAGAMGIICPMINSAEEAAEFVSYLRYPPLGQRSFGPTRAAFAIDGYSTTAANDHILAFAMIETAAGVENLEAIAATPGLDGLYVGPADLTLGFTNGRLAPGFDREEPEMIELQQRIASVAKAAGIHATLHCGSSDYAARGIEWGFDMVTVQNDVRFLATAAGAVVDRFRTLTGSVGSDSNSGAY